MTLIEKRPVHTYQARTAVLAFLYRYDTPVAAPSSPARQLFSPSSPVPSFSTPRRVRPGGVISSEYLCRPDTQDVTRISTGPVREEPDPERLEYSKSEHWFENKFEPELNPNF